MKPVLHIGNKNYSSWSLRPWLVLRWANIAFDEHTISLAQPGYGIGKIEQVLEISPTGKVPALHKGALRIHDSLAIAEWAAEEAPDSLLWPSASEARALARAATCEMHSGFEGVRRDMPMNIHRRCAQPPWPEDTQRGIKRITELWTGARETYGGDGPWLFGARSIADAFYAPVVTRFRTYSVPLPEKAQAYCETVLSDSAFLEWEKDGLADAGSFPKLDSLYA